MNVITIVITCKYKTTNKVFVLPVHLSGCDCVDNTTGCYVECSQRHLVTHSINNTGDRTLAWGITH